MCTVECDPVTHSSCSSMVLVAALRLPSLKPTSPPPLRVISFIHSSVTLKHARPNTTHARCTAVSFQTWFLLQWVSRSSASRRLCMRRAYVCLVWMKLAGGGTTGACQCAVGPGWTCHRYAPTSTSLSRGVPTSVCGSGLSSESTKIPASLQDRA